MYNYFGRLDFSRLKGGLRSAWLLCLVAVSLLTLASCAPKSKKWAEMEEIPPVNASAATVIPDDLNTPKDRPLTLEELAALGAPSGIDFDLDVHETEEVEKWFVYFTQKHPKTFQKWLKRAEPYLPYVRQAMREHGLPEDLAILPFVESGYNPKAYSRAHACGMWQFIRGTGRRYGLESNWWIDERRDPYLATHAAAEYLTELHEMFGDWYLALAGYNAGEAKIARALKKTGAGDFFELTENNHKLSRRARLRPETRNYVPKFIAVMKIFQNLEPLGFEPVNWNAAPALADIEVPGGTDLLALAKASGMSWDDFHSLNPAFRRMVSPPNQATVVHLPIEQLQAAQGYVSSPTSRPFAGYQVYSVRSGDSWSRISHRFGVPISVLKQVNNRHSNLIKPGQKIMVPAAGSTRTVASASKSSKSSTASASASTSRTRAYAKERANYKVRQGDSLYSISKRFHVSVATLKKSNGLRSSGIKAGQRLYIPDVSAKQTQASKASAENVKNKAQQQAQQMAREAAQTADASKETQLVEYRVKKGDTLYSIARRHGVTAKSLKEWNSLGGNLIKPGDTIKVYVK